MGSGHGPNGAAVRAMVDGPQVPPQLSERQVQELADAKEQGERYAVRAEFLAELGLVKLVKLNKHVSELQPDTLYLAVPVLLKIAGSVLSALDCGPVGVG
jgi:hypothetical protein